jgi:hypothetical protein
MHDQDVAPAARAFCLLGSSLLAGLPARLEPARRLACPQSKHERRRGPPVARDPRRALWPAGRLELGVAATTMVCVRSATRLAGAYKRGAGPLCHRPGVAWSWRASCNARAAHFGRRRRRLLRRSARSIITSAARLISGAASFISARRAAAAELAAEPPAQVCRLRV